MPWPQPHHCSCRTKVKFNNQRKNWEGFSGDSDQLCSNSSADSKRQESPPQPDHSRAVLRPVKISKHQSPLYNMEMTQLKTSIGSLVKTGHLLPSLLWIMDITRNEKTDCLKVIKQALTPRTYHTVLRHVHNPHHGQEKPAGEQPVPPCNNSVWRVRYKHHLNPYLTEVCTTKPRAKNQQAEDGSDCNHSNEELLQKPDTKWGICTCSVHTGIVM